MEMLLLMEIAMNCEQMNQKYVGGAAHNKWSFEVVLRNEKDNPIEDEWQRLN